MDKGKSGRSGSVGNKKHVLGSNLIALGAKRPGDTTSSSTAGTSRSLLTTSSVKTSSGSSSNASIKREASSSSANAPPLKKLRVSPPRSGSTGSSTYLSGASSSSSSKSAKNVVKKELKDPLEFSSVTIIPINPSDFTTDKFFGLLEKAEKNSNFDLAQSLLNAALKRLKSSSTREKEQLTICQNFLLVSKTYPSLFQISSVVENLISLAQTKAKEQKMKLFTSLGIFSSFALTMLSITHADKATWPLTFVQLWLDDASGDRLWVDLPAFKMFTENFLYSFGTVLPPANLLPPSDAISSGNSSPNPTSDETLGIFQELKLMIQEYSPVDMPVLNRFQGMETMVESQILEYAGEIVTRKGPDIPRNLLKALGFACGMSGVRAWVASRIEQWLHNGKLGRLAQDLLLHLCTNSNCNTSSDADVVSQISKLRMKTKPLVHFYGIALREMVRESDTNMRNVLNQIIYNELTPQRNPNNLPLLGTIFAGVPECFSVTAEIFMDLLLKKEDFHPALRLLFREIVRSARYECDVSKFAFGIMEHRDITWNNEIRERAFTAVTDLILLAMFLLVSPQIREASAVAQVRGEAKENPILVNFRTQISLVQTEAISWMYSVVPKMYRPSNPKCYVTNLNKILLKDPISDMLTKDGWPPETDKIVFTRLCQDVTLQENSLVYILLMGLSKDHSLTAPEAFEIVEQIVFRLASHKAGFNLQKVEILEFLFRLTEYRHPDNITLPRGYEPPKLAITNSYWRAWILLCIICAHNPAKFGKRGWQDYPTLKIFMEMCMTNSFVYPTSSCSVKEGCDTIIARELQTASMEKEEILEFESHLAAASSKATITESTSLLLAQLMRMDPFGPPRTPPAWVLLQLQNANEQMGIGHLLCRSRDPDFLLDLIQSNSEPMPWLSRLVSEGSFEILPDQCLCEFMMTHISSLERAIQASKAEENSQGRSPKKFIKGVQIVGAEITKEDAKLLQLLKYLQDKIYQNDDEACRKIIEYFFRRLSASKSSQRMQSIMALKLLLTKTDDDRGSDASEDWLVDCLPALNVFNLMQESILILLRQALQVENDPFLVSRYLYFMATWIHLAEDLEGLTLDVAQLVVERNGLICTMMSKTPSCFQSLFDIFCSYMKKIRGPTKESYNLTSDNQDQVLVQWPSDGCEGIMNILVIHAIVISLSSYSAHTQPTTGKKKQKDLRYTELLDIWFPKVRENAPKGFLLNSLDEAQLFPDWIKLRMIRSDNPRLLAAALQDLNVEQLMLFIQHFGVPVQSMTALLYCLDTVSEQDPEQVVKCMVNAPYMYTLVTLQWKRGASGGEKFVNILKAKCGVPDVPKKDVSKDHEKVRPTLSVVSLKDHPKASKRAKNIDQKISTRISSPPKALSLADINDDSSVEELSKQLLQLSSPPTRRRLSMPTSGIEDTPQAARRHSSYIEPSSLERPGDYDESYSNNLGKLVDKIIEVEPCIVRNALDYQIPLLFGRTENTSNCRSFLMTALIHQAGWETLENCVNLFLREFDSSYDPGAILDLIQATYSNPKLWQGLDKYVPKHQTNPSVINISSKQLLVMADYIIEEISLRELKSTKFSISNLLGSSQLRVSVPVNKSYYGLQSRVRLWLQCLKFDKEMVNSAVHSIIAKKWRNPFVKKFVHQVYVEFPEVVLVENWKWKTEEIGMSDEEVSSLLDSISHALITALANTVPGKDWAKKQAHDYEICLRKLAACHPTLLLRQLKLMGSLLEGRVHLEPSAFHQNNHNLPFVVYLSLIDLMQPSVLKHLKVLRPIFTLYLKMFKNYAISKDYSSSLHRFCILIHNMYSINPQDVQEFLSPHYSTLKDLSNVKYYVDVFPLQNLVACLLPPNGPSSTSSVLSAGSASNNKDIVAQAVISVNDRLTHASNDEEIVPILQELDGISSRAPNILNHFSEKLNYFLKSESDGCRSLAFSLALKHATYFPSATAAYLETILQLLQDDNSHIRNGIMDRLHEFVVLAHERGEDILMKMFEISISSNVNFLSVIQKSMGLLKHYYALG